MLVDKNLFKSSAKKINFSKIRNVLIIGNGNVALDIARTLIKSSDELIKTDVSDDFLQKTKHENVPIVNKVIIVGRRGPLQTMFTAKELKETIGASNTLVNIDKEILEKEAKTLEANQPDRRTKRILEILKFYSSYKTTEETRKVELKIEFFKSPSKILVRNSSKVQPELIGVEFNKTSINEQGRLIQTDIKETIECDLVIPCVGQMLEKDSVLENLVYLNNTKLQNDRGKVTKLQKETLEILDGASLYVSGWAKTGPNGVIATTMLFAHETADRIIEDIRNNTLRVDKNRIGLLNIAELLSKTKKVIITKDDWFKIDLQELKNGQMKKKCREKVSSFEDIVRIIE